MGHKLASHEFIFSEQEEMVGDTVGGESKQVRRHNGFYLSLAAVCVFLNALGHAKNQRFIWKSWGVRKFAPARLTIGTTVWIVLI